MYDDLQEEHSEIEYEDVDIDSFLQPVPQFDAHLQAVKALKQEQKGFFEKIAHVLADQAGLQETSQLLAFVIGAAGTAKSYLLKMVRDRIKLVLDSNQHQML